MLWKEGDISFVTFFGLWAFIYFFPCGRNRLLLKTLICNTVQTKRKMITPVSCCSAISLPVGKERSFLSALTYYKK